MKYLCLLLLIISTSCACATELICNKTNTYSSNDNIILLAQSRAEIWLDTQKTTLHASQLQWMARLTKVVMCINRSLENSAYSIKKLKELANYGVYLQVDAYLSQLTFEEILELQNSSSVPLVLYINEENTLSMQELAQLAVRGVEIHILTDLRYFPSNQLAPIAQVSGRNQLSVYINTEIIHFEDVENIRNAVSTGAIVKYGQP